MANITILEALQLSLNATKKYVDENNQLYWMEPYEITGTKTKLANVDISTLTKNRFYTFNYKKYSEINKVGIKKIYDDGTKKSITTLSQGLEYIYFSDLSSIGFIMYIKYSHGTSSKITGTFGSTASEYTSTLTPMVLDTQSNKEFIPTKEYDPATKKYVDEKVAEANANSGYTHPDSHPASMITGLATVATSGSYNDLNDKPTIPDVSDKANISGQVFTGAIEAPTVIASTYFRTPALVGEGDNSAYYHRVNFGYQNHDYWEFHEYGGDYRFYENKNGTAAGGTMIANIKSTYSDFKGEVRENGTRVYSPNNKPTADDLGITIPSIDGLATETYVNNKVAGLIDSAPEALNTLNELATALGNDANFATTISNQIGLKANSADLATVATTGNYNDLTNKPTIPSAYTHPSTHPASMITGLSKVATSGSYNDLSNKPTIPTIPDSLPANGGNADTVNNFRIWSGTQAQFDAIRTKDANTIYLIKEG